MFVPLLVVFAPVVEFVLVAVSVLVNEKVVFAQLVKLLVVAIVVIVLVVEFLLVDVNVVKVNVVDLFVLVVVLAIVVFLFAKDTLCRTFHAGQPLLDPCLIDNANGSHHCLIGNNCFFWELL